MSWYNTQITPPNESVLLQAQAHQNQLTKPPGSLGQLESIATALAAMQGKLYPSINRPFISIFASDHGVADEGVSAFPQVVTTEMVRNFARGGAAISVLANIHQAHFEVVNLGTVSDPGPLDAVVDGRIAAGTANFVRQPAMTDSQLLQALAAGELAIERALSQQADLFIGGEMGIANTTSASALAAALTETPLVELVGPGTGINSEQMTHKIAVIQQGLQLHQAALADPLKALACLGGFEIAGLVGAYIHGAQRGLPLLVDGFITTVAALVAVKINPGCRPWMLFSHGSAEPGHQRVLESLGAQPLVDLNLRLGEASGAAVVIPLLQQACALHNHMATFSQAAVTDKA